MSTDFDPNSVCPDCCGSGECEDCDGVECDECYGSNECRMCCGTGVA